MKSRNYNMPLDDLCRAQAQVTRLLYLLEDCSLSGASADNYADNFDMFLAAVKKMNKQRRFFGLTEINPTKSLVYLGARFRPFPFYYKHKDFYRRKLKSCITVESGLNH